MSDDRSVKAGKITGSQIITGDKNKAVMHDVTVSLLPADDIDIKNEIAALREELSALRSPDQGKLDRALQDAEEEAAKDDPDKDEIGGAIERAVKYAQKADDFSGKLEKIGKRLAPVVSWLGENWTKILAGIGITLGSG